MIYNAIKIVRHLCTAFSVLFAVPAITVIVLGSNRISKRYASLLLIVEVCLSTIENPHIPIPGGPSLYVEIWTGMVTMSIALFFVCFLERHQAVQLPGSRWLLSFGVRVLMIILIFAISIVYPVMLKSVRARWSAFPIDRAECFDYAACLRFAVISLIGGAFGAATITLLAWRTFSSLKSTSKMSSKIRELNLSLTRVLIIQVLAPVALIILPLAGVMAAVLLATEGRLSLAIGYLFMSFHPIAHSLILLICTPMYRRKMVSIWKKIMSKRFAEAMSITSSATWT